MDYVKEAFQKVRQDVDHLKNELNFLKENMIEICEIIKKLRQNTVLDRQTDRQTNNLQKTTDSTHLSTHNLPFKPLNNQNLSISTGNEGAPTDRQTDRQTDNSTHNWQKNPLNFSAQSISSHPFKESTKTEDKIGFQDRNSIDDAIEILNSLDNIKKEIRLKFKRLTEQELLVFSSIYQLDTEKGYSDYKSLSEKLNLSESSIRDYIGRLLKKGIPVEKKKINNKNIQLSISQNLKKIASLSTIIQLRDI